MPVQSVSCRDSSEKLGCRWLTTMYGGQWVRLARQNVDSAVLGLKVYWLAAWQATTFCSMNEQSLTSWRCNDSTLVWWCRSGMWTESNSSSTVDVGWFRGRHLAQSLVHGWWWFGWQWMWYVAACRSWQVSVLWRLWSTSSSHHRTWPHQGQVLLSLLCATFYLSL